MSRKKKNIPKDDFSDIKEETEEVEEPKEVPKKGRKEEDYFFPHKRVTVKASSLKEALNKIK